MDGIFCLQLDVAWQALGGRAAAGWMERSERLARRRRQKPKRYRDGWGMEGTDIDSAEVSCL